METATTALTAFSGSRRVASGPVQALLLEVKEKFDRGEANSLLIFDDHTGRQVDFDLRGTRDEVLARLASHPFFQPAVAAPKARTGPGRPKLGVVSREVSLLPRHWEWLEQQPNGISAAIRRLVDEARRENPDTDRRRAAQEAANRFMMAMAGNLAGFEEASRALFAGDRERFEQQTREWPEDVRAYAERLAHDAFPG